MTRLLSTYWQDFVHLLFPELCEGCKASLVAGEKLICIQCETSIAYTNYHSWTENATSQRIAGRFPFKYASSLAYFTEDGLIQHFVHLLKYKNKTDIGVLLGRMMGQAIRSSDWQVDAVIPVPLHPKREAKRGYNQSYFLALGVAEILKVPLLNQSLKRVKNTSTQTEKNRIERMENVKDAFVFSPLKEQNIKHLLLVDDVLTTGATIEACALAILQQKQMELSIMSVAIASN